MKISASELNEEKRKRHLIKQDESLTVIEIERGLGTGLRRFNLFDKNGNSVGIFYEDDPTTKYQDPETGAHFDFDDICRRLSEIKFTKERFGENGSHK